MVVAVVLGALLVAVVALAAVFDAQARRRGEDPRAARERWQQGVREHRHEMRNRRRGRPPAPRR